MSGGLSLAARTFRGIRSDGGSFHASSRTVHVWWPDVSCVRMDDGVHQQRLDLACRRDPSGGEILWFFLGSGPPKMPRDDQSRIEVKIETKKTTLLLLIEQESKEINKLVDWFDCWCAQSTVPLYVYRGKSRPVPKRSPIAVSLDG